MAIYRDEQGNIISRKSPVTGKSKRSEAQKRADRKYDAKHYGTITGKAKLQDIAVYERYAAKYGVTKSKLITSCINYCINNNIDITGGIKLNSTENPSQDDTE